MITIVLFTKMSSFSYTIVQRAQWFAQMKSPGYFQVLPFIHSSTEPQLRNTYRRKFATMDTQQQLVVVCIDLDRFEPDIVKWEVNQKDGQLYPHIYGVITPKQVRWVKDIEFISKSFTPV
jgi:uncharacterized protein (DUF952 family)